MMHPTVEHITADLDRLTEAHRYAHRCTTSGDPQTTSWYNPTAGVRRPCPQFQQLQHVREQLTALLDVIRNASTDPAHVDAVTTGMTGFDLDTLMDEDREGWRATARMALDASAVHLQVTRPPVPVLDLHAADPEAEGARFAAAVEEWRPPYPDYPVNPHANAPFEAP